MKPYKADRAAKRFWGETPRRSTLEEVVAGFNAARRPKKTLKRLREVVPLGAK
jgi:hypothetical protein